MKRLLFIFVLCLLTALFCCACTAAAPPDESEAVQLSEHEGYCLAVPQAEAERLVIRSGQEDVLFSVYSREMYEQDGSSGLLFSVLRYDQAGYEQFLCGEGGSLRFFARDDAYYYGWLLPTYTPLHFDSDDSQRLLDEYSRLYAAVEPLSRERFISDNSLTAYDDAEARQREFSYAGAHMQVDYYPYYAYDGTREACWTLVLSQPARQGEGGVWAVERWTEQGATYLFYPLDEQGRCAADHYAALQSACDAGEQPARLDAAATALLFVQTQFRHSAATAQSFGQLQAL